MRHASLLVLIVATACATTNPGNVDAELQRLESAKWHPASLGGQQEFVNLFADDFVTVEYGADLNGAVDRKAGTKALMSSPDMAKLIDMLNHSKIDLSDWQFLHIDGDGVVVSYHVNVPAFGWTAYATSVWAKRNGQWQTIFYQASRSKH